MTTDTGISTGILFSKSSNERLTLAVFVVMLVYLLLRVPSPQFFLESDDQGYQMALGMAVATGRFPGFDFVSQYGPFVAFSSWLAYAMSGNVVGEIVVCAAGYAAAIALVYRYVARHVGIIAGVACSIALLVLFSRYYKWYYWLLPLVVLVLSDTYAKVRSSGSAPWRILAGWGALVGVSGLFRYDLLIEGLVFGSCVIAAVELTPRDRLKPNLKATIRQIAAFAAACIAPPLLYSLLILVFRGWHQLVLVLYSVVDGAVDTVEYYGVAPFQIVRTGPVGLLQILIPFVYVTAVLISLARMCDSKTKPWHREEAFPLFCAALMGLGLFPQALHRADDSHLLQVIPPLIITLALLCSVALNAGIQGAKRFFIWSGLVIFFFIMLMLGTRVTNDLGPVARNPLTLWPGLAGMPESAADQHPVADMAAAIKRLTPPDSTVFIVLPQTRMPMLFFAQRHQPGLFPTYEPGMFSGPLWVKENVARLEKSPPDYIVLQKAFNAQVLGLPAPYAPELLAQWQRDYRHLIYQNDWFFLLARN